MIPYLGDFVEDDVVYLMFNTFSSDDPSASCTITNLLNTDVHIHKDDNLTQRNNAAGITVSVNFDGITGSHLIKIDTNDNTVAGFWVTGSDYFVRIEGTTIDGATINSVVGHFSIENRFMRGTDSAALAATALSDVTWTDAKAVHLDANISSRNATTPPTVGAIRTEMEGAGTKLTLALGDTDELQTNQGNWITAVGFSTHSAADVKTAVEAAGSKLTLVLEDTADMQPNQGNWATAVGFSTHSAADVKTTIEAGGSSIATILADTNELQTDWVNGGRLDLLIDAILLDTGTTLDALIKRILGLEQENIFIDNTTYAGVHMTGCRIRIYSVAGSVGGAGDVIATYTMTATYTGDEMDDYKVVKA